ncbi:cupin domain-containing protein [Actinoplanes subglobosus]|uniref:Cupin domain-containing protein n=1 Tax=Actinoplanes subglobosus TaxID=1547892 RepID=A0ABV8J4R4_9ACTN
MEHVTEPVTVFRLNEVSVAHEPASADVVVSGAPTLGATAVTTLDGLGAEIGVWEMSAGAVRDVEAEEAFVLLAGRGVIEVEGGPAVEIRPGDLVRLAAGTRTVWHVTEPLRKVYVTGA